VSSLGPWHVKGLFWDSIHAAMPSALKARQWLLELFERYKRNYAAECALRLLYFVQLSDGEISIHSFIRVSLSKEDAEEHTTS